MPISLESDTQRLHVVPAFGGGIASWDWHSAHGWVPLLRPFDILMDDPARLACFPLLPWSNRISQGGFEFDGVFYPIAPNRENDPYPIHGDAWLQPWHIVEHTETSIELSLESHGFNGNPYDYVATETFSMQPTGLTIELEVMHLGTRPMPYGLGLHPCFRRNAATRLRAKSDAVWLSGKDPIPVTRTDQYPPSWDYNSAAPLDGPLIDNCYTGWDGRTVIEYPDLDTSIIVLTPDSNGYSLLYRPPEAPYFCFEPITHPIDAFHMPGQPGLKRLDVGESMSMKVRFLIR